MQNDEQNDIHDAARASFDAIRAASHDPAMTKRNSGAALSAVAGGVVDMLTERAASFAASAIAPASGSGAGAVWSDVLDTLAALGLSPVLYCSRTGRRMGLIAPDAWSDYLETIADLGETRAADEMRGRLVSAIIAQKAHCVAPVVLVSSGAALATIRETSAPDFLCRALCDIFPLPRDAQSDGQAARAESLGHARAAIAALPSGAVQYACEVVTLYLSYVQPARLPGEQNPLVVYGSGASADLVAPFGSSASLGHFCGRIVQSMLHLIASAKLRPVDKLRPADLRTLKVHWRGLPEYEVLRDGRRMIRAARRSVSRAGALPSLGRAGRSYVDALDDTSAGLLSGFADALFADALSLSTAAGVAGRSLPVELESEAQAQTALDRRAELREIKEQSASDDLALDLCDLSSLAASGAADGFAPMIDSDDDLLTFGQIDVAAFDWLDDDDDDVDDDDADDLAGVPDWLQSDLIAQADKQAAKPRKAAKSATSSPHGEAVAQAVAAMHSGAVPAAGAGAGAGGGGGPDPVRRGPALPARRALPDAPATPAAPAAPRPAFKATRKL